jgi:hypothetical protein
MALQIDVPDIIETLDDVTIAAAGQRLQSNIAWNVLKTVNLTVQDDGGTAITAKVLDKNPTLGPLTQCYTAAGAPVAGTVDAILQGY